MRLLLMPLVMFLAAVPGVAADVEIVVPEGKINPNKHYLFAVTGLTNEDLPTAKILCEPTTAQAVGVTGWAGEQYLWWIAREKGRHFVGVCVVRDGKAVVATATVEVIPPPPPVPPVPVPVPGDLAIVVVSESANRTAQEALVLLGLRKYLASNKLWYRLADPDLKDAVTGQTPKWLAAAKAQVASSSVRLPAVVVGSVADGVFSPVVAEAVPETVEATVEIVKRYEQTSSPLDLPKGPGGVIPQSLFVPTPIHIVKRMLIEAKLTRKDVLVDMGSGDGRIPILAAKMYGCQAVGFEIDPRLVLQSQAAADGCGVADLVTFYHVDARKVRFGNATVVTMYLDESLNREVAARFGQLRHGARIISHAHRIPGLPAERTVSVGDDKLFLWNVPLSTARLAGPRHPGPHGSCLMCLGNHLMGSHKVPRKRLDSVGYKRWSTIHDNCHNKGGLLLCAL